MYNNKAHYRQYTDGFFKNQRMRSVHEKQAWLKQRFHGGMKPARAGLGIRMVHTVHNCPTGGNIAHSSFSPDRQWWSPGHLGAATLTKTIQVLFSWCEVDHALWMPTSPLPTGITSFPISSALLTHRRTCWCWSGRSAPCWVSCPNVPLSISSPRDLFWRGWSVNRTSPESVISSAPTADLAPPTLKDSVWKTCVISLSQRRTPPQQSGFVPFSSSVIDSRRRSERAKRCCNKNTLIQRGPAQSTLTNLREA